MIKANKTIKNPGILVAFDLMSSWVKGSKSSIFIGNMMNHIPNNKISQDKKYKNLLNLLLPKIKDSFSSMFFFLSIKSKGTGGPCARAEN